MKYLKLLLLLSFCASLHAQSTAESVYDILQVRCVSCHGNVSPAGGLDLKGIGPDKWTKMLTVGAAMIGQPSSNTHANAQQYQIAYPGNAERSTLFRKINNGLQSNLILDAAEGDKHDSNLHIITDAEKELIRQWILFGTPDTTARVVDPAILDRYYAGNSVSSFSTPPPAPDPNEGFQVHMGPFFLEEDDEREYFTKYPTLLPSDVEIIGIEALFGSYSHHFILFEFTDDPSTTGDGFRSDNAHVDTRILSLHAFPDTVELPKNTAFFVDAGSTLDLNAHYINYSSTKVASCEVYINIYTQPRGIAKQEMKVALVPNINIFIPNNGQSYTFKKDLVNRSGHDIYLWQLASHTHQWGTDFNIYSKDIFGNQDDLIYDAEYVDGDPNGFFTGYDYEHPPIMEFPDFRTLPANEGLIFEASYENNGSRAVFFGPTSEDEMMIMVFLYVEDTAGLATTAIDPVLGGKLGMSLAPNPMADQSMLEISHPQLHEVSLKILDVRGRLQLPLQKIRLNSTGSTAVEIKRNALAPGVYFCTLSDNEGNILKTQKLFVH